MISKKNLYISFISIILLIITLYIALNYTIFQDIYNSNTQSLADSFNSTGILGYFIVIFVVILEVVFIGIVPSIVLYAAAGIIYGGFKGSLIIWIGNIIGAAICFYLSKTYLKSYFEKKVSKKQLEKFNNYANKYGHYAIFFLRLNPLTSSDAFSYIAGMTQMKFKPFILGTSIGLIPLIWVSVYFGSEFITQSEIIRYIFIVGTIAYMILTIYFFTKKG